MPKTLVVALALLVLAACGQPVAVNDSQTASWSAHQATVHFSNLLFKDDFSNTGSGWDEASDANGLTGYFYSGYRIQVISADFTFWGTPNKSFQSNLSIEVDATKNGGPDSNAFGIICRYQDKDNFYRFYITSDGYAGIIKRVGGNLTVISSQDGKLHPVKGISTGASTNHIRADCLYNTLTLYANGIQVAQATDASLNGGGIGLIVESFTSGGVDIIFHNLFVYGE